MEAKWSKAEIISENNDNWITNMLKSIKSLNFDDTDSMLAHILSTGLFDPIESNLEYICCRIVFCTDNTISINFSRKQ